MRKPVRVGVGGQVGSGKTALVGRLARSLSSGFSVAAITNDIFTKEDAEFLVRTQALPADRVIGVETGGCPHTAVREDVSMVTIQVSIPHLARISRGPRANPPLIARNGVERGGDDR